MTDQSTASTYPAPATEPAATPAPEPTAAPAASASDTVTLTRADLEALLARAVASAAPSTSSAPAVAVPKVLPADALKVGDFVLEQGRAAVVLEVLTTSRDVDGQAWTQVCYRLGVFAEDRLVDAETVGALS